MDFVFGLMLFLVLLFVETIVLLVWAVNVKKRYVFIWVNFFFWLVASLIFFVWQKFGSALFS